MIEQFFPNIRALGPEIWQSTLETLYMTLVSGVVAGVLGVILGVILLLTQEGGLKEQKVIYYTLDKAVNIFRALPFIILLALIVPITRFIAGSAIGTTAAIVPLIVATTPFFARQIQNVLVEVDSGIIEAAQSMGLTTRQIIFKVYLREALPGIIRVSALTVINLVGLTAMAGVVGGGGLGNLAIARGYNRYQLDVIYVATAIILVIVFISQWIGDYLVKKTTH